MQIEVTGLDSINKALKEIEEKTGDTRPIVNEMTNHLYNVISESFEKQSTPDGINWSPIKAASRKRIDGSQKLLYKTGHMQNSLYAYSVIGGGSVIGINATSNGYQYPLVHQFGTKDGKISARPFMPIKLDGTLYDKTKKELDEIVEDYFEFLD